MATVAAMLVFSACSSDESSTDDGSGTTAPGARTGDAATTSTVDPDTPQVATPIVAHVPTAPIPFAGSDDRTHTVYELFLTNVAREPATITEIDVLDADSGANVTTLDAARLDGIFVLANSSPAGRTLGPAQSGIVYLHLVFDGPADVPEALTHDIAVSYPTMGSLDESAVATVTVDDREVPVLGPPLKGEGYVAADGCCDSARHRMATLPVNGVQNIAQRFAIDWEQIDDQGRIYNGDKFDVNSYAIYGDEVLAMADGTVVKVVDGLPDQVPGSFPDEIDFDEADGNSIVLDIGGGYYLNYAHMQNGSLRFKVGDTVKKGDVIGLVGNTGNSLAPHLHVHLMDSPLPVASSGVPYTIDSFTVSGVSVSTEAFDRAEADGTPLEYAAVEPPKTHAAQYPMDQSIVTF